MSRLAFISPHSASLVISPAPAYILWGAPITFLHREPDGRQACPLETRILKQDCTGEPSDWTAHPWRPGSFLTPPS